MASSAPASVTFSLKVLAEHGGRTAAHKDGWGIAYYAGTDVQLIRDTTCASNSRWVQFVAQQELRSTLVMSHIRMATEGAVAIKNTQPFVRELGGRMHTFAHNGHLPAIREQEECQLGSFQPIGDTDSEYAFCLLLARLESLWRDNKHIPKSSCRRDVVADFAKDVRKIGLANFVYCDGEAIYAHGHRRKQADGEYKSPGLYVLRRRCTNEDTHAGAAGVSVTSPDQEVALFASVPLTTESWEPLGEGELVVASAAEFIRQPVPRQ